ncbi:MAG: tetratricopeptide repeat protein [Sphingobacteriales bacterium]|nr:tetratricopeptide repeat protein [Sphingobacteriales bacterium]
MKRKASLFAAILLTGKLLFAQSVDDGKRFIYYERYKSAKDLLQSIVSSNPANSDAVYYLGQALLGLDDIAGARQVYQNGLSANPGSALLHAGLGHVYYYENKPNEAKGEFEGALNMTKSKDLTVLNAIAHATADTKVGDFNYGVEKARMAIDLARKKVDPDYYVNLGDNYRALINGGEAKQAFDAALAINPKLAEAKYKTGKIYETQNNKDIFLPLYEEATQLDPNYGPAWKALYVYWYFRDVTKAEIYFDAYVKVSDQDERLEYDRIDLKYAQEKYDDAISSANALAAKLGNGTKARLYRLLGYAFMKKNDFNTAKSDFITFLQKAKPDEVTARNYADIAKTIGSIAGSEKEAFTYYQKAIDTDTLPKNKSDLAKQASDLARKLGDPLLSIEWMTKSYNLAKNPSNVDLYNLGRACLDAGLFTSCDSIGKVYAAKYPTHTYGYYLRALANWRIDTTMELGSANPYFEKLIEVGAADSVNNKSQLKLAYRYFVGYYATVKRDYPTAITYCDKILNLFPGDADASSLKQQLQSPAPKNPPAKPATKNTGKGTAAAGIPAPAKTPAKATAKKTVKKKGELVA